MPSFCLPNRNCIASEKSILKYLRTKSTASPPTSLKSCFKIFIYDDDGMRENNIEDIIKRVENTFSNRSYISKLKTSNKNWLDTDIDTVLNGIVAFLKSQI